MERELHIAIPDDSTVRVVQAEITDPQPSIPASFRGKLLNVSPLDLLKFESRKEDVSVMFDAKCYRFNWVARDGSFELHRE
jgi:hypothetical protein